MPQTSPHDYHPLELPSLEEIDEEAYKAAEEEEKKKKRKRKRTLIFDYETEMESVEMKINVKDINVGVRKADFKKQVLIINYGTKEYA